MSSKQQAIYNSKDYKNPKELYPEKDLSKMVYNYLSQENHNRSAERSKEKADNIRFYPSSIGKQDRDIVMQMLGYVGKPIQGKSLMVMQNGTSFHNRMEDIFEKMGILVAPELSIKSEQLKISGRSDAIIWNYLKEDDEPDGPEIELINPEGQVIYKGPNNYVLLVEFKSISENGFYGLAKSKPKIDHEMQLQLYFELTGIEKGIIYYENKNNQLTKEFFIEKDQEMIDKIIKRIKKLVKMAEKNEIPDADYIPTDFEARFSNYTDITFPNPNPFDFNELFMTEEEIEASNQLPF